MEAGKGGAGRSPVGGTGMRVVVTMVVSMIMAVVVDMGLMQGGRGGAQRRRGFRHVGRMLSLQLASHLLLPPRKFVIHVKRILDHAALCSFLVILFTRR